MYFGKEIINQQTKKVFFQVIAAVMTLCCVHATALGQLPLVTPGAETTATATAAPVDQTEESLSAPAAVSVRPEAEDTDIEARLQRILEASEWFADPQVKVEEGIVFLTGRTDTDTLKKWAGDLARGTGDVVAVVNRITVRQPPLLDTGPAVASLTNLWRGLIRTLPLLVVGAAVLVLAWYVAKLVAWVLMRSFTRREFLTPLLREVISRALAGLVFLLGLYIVLLIMGLARLAVTVLGGTGLIGLVLGIAFRDITENFLASIFLSIQRPFRSGDVIEVAGITGIVQRLTVRTTVLMTLEGNHVQIPNATIYKSTIRNFTSNPNTRESFSIGIGYDDATSDAQDIAMEVLKEHPAILEDPEPWVLVDNLGVSAVNLKIYFWIDTSKHSSIKVKSSVIRLVKRAFQENGIAIPDEGREVIIPREVPIRLNINATTGAAAALQSMMIEHVDEPAKLPAEKMSRREAEPVPEGVPGATPSNEAPAVCTNAEGGLGTEVTAVDSQAEGSRIPEEGADLLESKKKADQPVVENTH